MAVRAPTEEQLYDLLLLKYDKEIADAFLVAVQDVRAQADIPRLIDAIERGSIEQAVASLHLQPAAFDTLAEAIRTGYSESGGLAVAKMPPMTSSDGAAMVFRFSVRNPVAERWLSDHSSELVTMILDDQRAAIKQALVAGMAAGNNPRDTALDIVGRVDRTTGTREGGIIGLTANQEAYVRNARAELESGNPAQMRNYLERSMRDHRFDATVKKAIEAEQPVAKEDIAKIEQRYRDRLLKLRGDMIGRTESLTALRAAKDEAYRQAIEGGALKDTDVKKIWRSVGDNRVRHTHVDLNGDIVNFNEPFVSPSGARMMFPGDTSRGAGPEEIIGCRCSVEYRADFLSQIGRLEGLPDKTAPEPTTVYKLPDPLKPGEVETPEERLMKTYTYMNLPPDERSDFEQYFFSPQSFAVNSYLRGQGGLPGYQNEEAQANRLLAAFDKYASPLRQEITVYRGIQASLGDILGNYYVPYELGSTFEHRGFMSTSLDRRTAEDFLHLFDDSADRPGVVALIRVPAGTKVVAGNVGGQAGGFLSDEQEILLRHGTKLRLASYSKVPNYMGSGDLFNVEFEVVP